MLSPVLRCLTVSLILLLAICAGTIEPAVAKGKFSALAVDARTGNILFSSDADGLRHPASLTKVMTLYILFQEMKAKKIALDTRLSVSRYAAGRQPTKLGVKAGQSVSVGDAIKALVVLSANDIAVAVAEHIEGSEGAFARRMTETARSLGMSRTVFRNASGLPDPKQVTTARDMATLSLRVQRDFPQYYHYFRVSSFKFGKRTIRTHNRLLGRFAGTDGIKTGYIRASGFNLTTSAKRDDKRIIGVVMGGRTGRARDNYMIAMLNKAFPKCSRGSTLAAAVEGTSPRQTTTEITAEAKEPDEERVAKRAKKRGTGETPEPAGNLAGFDNQELAEHAETAANLPGTTFATVNADEANLARVSGEIANPDMASQQPVSVAPVEAGMPAEPPFEVKKPGDGTQGVVIVPTVNSNWNIQLGPFPTKKAAQDALYVARKMSPEMFADKQAFMLEVQKGDETLFRARMSGFSANAAKHACRTLLRKGLDCSPLAPQS